MIREPRDSLVAQLVKNLRLMRVTLGWEGPLEEGMAPHSSFLAWRIPWTENPGGLQSIGLQGVAHDLSAYHTHTHSVLNMNCLIHSSLKKKSKK